MSERISGLHIGYLTRLACFFNVHSHLQKIPCPNSFKSSAETEYGMVVVVAVETTTRMCLMESHEKDMAEIRVALKSIIRVGNVC